MTWGRIVDYIGSQSYSPSFFDPIAFNGPWIDLFTDGTCLWPKNECRVAAWAVVQASCCATPVDRQTSHVISAGHVQGVEQSAYRAELTFVCEALRFCHRHGFSARIWCDCQGVVTGVVGLLQKTRRVRSSGKHADLWTTIAELLDDMTSEHVCIPKVAAHQDVACTVDGFEAWCFLHNGLADSAAQFANMQRSPAFWKLHDRFMRQTHQEERKAHHIQQTLLQISRAVVFQKVAGEDIEQDMDPEPAMSQPNMPSPNPWPGIPEVAGCPAALAHKFGHRVVTSGV